MKLISANGVWNKSGEHRAPTYEEYMKYRLSQAGIMPDTIFLLPLFEGNNVVRDLAMWGLDNAGVNILTNEIISKLDAEIYGDIEPGQTYTPKVLMAYSGSANPFIKALNRRHDYIVRDAIFLGGPTLDGIFEDAQITNPNVKRVFNIWGSKEISIMYPFVANKKYSGNVDEYNIKIIGAGHFDYFYDPNKGEINARSSYFVAELTKWIYNKNADMNEFFNKNNVTYNRDSKTYVVDLSEIDYDPQLEWRNNE